MRFLNVSDYCRPVSPPHRDFPTCLKPLVPSLCLRQLIPTKTLQGSPSSSSRNTGFCWTRRFCKSNPLTQCCQLVLLRAKWPVIQQSHVCTCAHV